MKKQKNKIFLSTIAALVLASISTTKALAQIACQPVSAAANYAASLPGQVTIAGSGWLKDGIAWVPKGVNISGIDLPSTVYGKNSAVASFLDLETAYANLVAQGSLVLTNARSYGADSLRVFVSEAGLYQQSGIYDPNYATKIVGCVKTMRALGFVVIITMQWESVGPLQQGTGYARDPMTVGAWQTLMSALQIASITQDKGVILDVLNEPNYNNDDGSYQTPGWGDWQKVSKAW